MLEHCSNRYALCRAHETRNAHVFYEIKKLNDYGGLGHIALGGFQCFPVTRWGVANVPRYLHTGNPSIPPVLRGVTHLNTAYLPHSGAYNTERAQPLIQACISPRYVNTHPQHTKRALCPLTLLCAGLHSHTHSLCGRKTGMPHGGIGVGDRKKRAEGKGVDR